MNRGSVCHALVRMCGGPERLNHMVATRGVFAAPWSTFAAVPYDRVVPVDELDGMPLGEWQRLDVAVRPDGLLYAEEANWESEFMSTECLVCAIRPDVDAYVLCIVDFGEPATVYGVPPGVLTVDWEGRPLFVYDELEALA